MAELPKVKIGGNLTSQITDMVDLHRIRNSKDFNKLYFLPKVPRKILSLFIYIAFHNFILRSLLSFRFSP